MRYVGIDLFEAQPKALVHYSLKAVYQRLARWAASVRLVPGHPPEVLSRIANELLGTDLLLIDLPEGLSVLEGAWYFLPRMLREDSLVLWFQAPENAGGEGSFCTLGLETIRQKADQEARRIRRAA